MLLRGTQLLNYFARFNQLTLSITLLPLQQLVLIVKLSDLTFEYLILFCKI